MTKIGIFDSGCGGLSILKELLENNQKYNLYYYGDSANFPWGNKSKDELTSILTTIATWFQANKVELVIVGCHTIYSLFKNELSTIFNCTVLNLLSNTQQFYTKDNYSVLVTQNSYNTNLFKNFLTQNSDKTIEQIPCPNLANFIEINNFEKTVESISYYTQLASYPTIILGCTHYSLIKDTFEHHFKETTLINPIKHFLKTNKDNLPKSNKSSFTFKITGNQEVFNSILSIHLTIDNYIINNQFYSKESSNEKVTV